MSDTQDERSLAVVSDTGHLTQWTEADLAALRDTVAKDCNPSQFKVFVAAAQRLGLDPFARQIVPIVQGGRMTPQVTIDGFRLIAERTTKYAGQLGPFWCGADGVWQDVWLDDKPPVAAKVGALRRDFEQPMWGVARTKAYTKGGVWATMPDVMIAKVAESIALRKAFPAQLGGVYSDDEMAQAETTRREQAAIHAVEAVEADEPDEVSPVPPANLDERTASQDRQKQLAATLRTNGYETVTKADRFLAEHVGRSVSVRQLSVGVSGITIGEVCAVEDALGIGEPNLEGLPVSGMH